MGALITGLQALVGLGSLVCFVLVIVAFFQKGETNLGIICLVTLLLCGLGSLIAFIMGWVKAGPLGLQKIMLAWTGCWVAGIVLGVLNFVVTGGGG